MSPPATPRGTIHSQVRTTNFSRRLQCANKKSPWPIRYITLPRFYSEISTQVIAADFSHAAPGLPRRVFINLGSGHFRQRFFQKKAHRCESTAGYLKRFPFAVFAKSTTGL